MTPSALSVLFGRPSVTSSTGATADSRPQPSKAGGESATFAGVLQSAGRDGAGRAQNAGTDARTPNPEHNSAASQDQAAPQDIDSIGTTPEDSSADSELLRPMPRNSEATREMSVEPPAGRSARRPTGIAADAAEGTAKETAPDAKAPRAFAVSHTGIDALRVVSTTLDDAVTGVTVIAGAEGADEVQATTLPTGASADASTPSNPAPASGAADEVVTAGTHLTDEQAGESGTDSSSASPTPRLHAESAADGASLVDVAEIAAETDSRPTSTSANQGSLQGGAESAGSGAQTAATAAGHSGASGARPTELQVPATANGTESSTPSPNAAAATVETGGLTAVTAVAGTATATPAGTTADTPATTNATAPAGTTATTPATATATTPATAPAAASHAAIEVPAATLHGMPAKAATGEAAVTSSGTTHSTVATDTASSGLTTPSNAAGLTAQKNATASASQTGTSGVAARTDAAGFPAHTETVASSPVNPAAAPGNNAAARTGAQPALTERLVSDTAASATAASAKAENAPEPGAPTSAAPEKQTSAAAGTQTREGRQDAPANQPLPNRSGSATAARPGAEVLTAQADGLATDSAERPAGNTGDQGNTGRAETTQNTSRTGSGAPRVTGATILDARTNNATSLTGTETKTANANAGGETGTRSVAAPATAVQPEQASTATGRLAEAHTLSPTNSKPGSDQAGEQAHRQAVNLAPSEEATDAVKTSARAGSDQATRPAADQTSRTPADQATRPAAEQPNNTADTGRAAPSQTRVPGQPTEAAASPRPAPASQPLDPRPAPQQLDASRPALAFTEFDSTSESAPHPRFQLTDRDARPSGARANVSLSFASAQEPATTAKADRPVFTLRSLYDAGSAAADQPASAATAEASARALDSTPAGLARDLPGHAIDSGTTRPGNERTDSRESPAEMASREANATSPSAGGNAQGFSGGGDDARQQNAFAQPTGTQAIAGTTPAEAIFEMPSLDPASLDADSGHLLDNRILEVLDEWFGETSPTATDRALGGGRSRTGTVASAWLRAVRTAIKSDGPPQDPAAWKEVTIELEDGLGSVNIRARRDSDLLSLQIFTTDPTTGDKLSSATSRLESELRDRYGADVNLSFGSDGGHQQGDSAAAGSADRVNSISAGQGLDTSESNDSETRRGADRVWVG